MGIGSGTERKLQEPPGGYWRQCRWPEGEADLAGQAGQQGSRSHLRPTVRSARMQVSDVPVEVARLVGLVGAVRAAVAPLSRVREDVPPQQELLVCAVEHLATHAASAAAAHALLLWRNQYYEHINACKAGHLSNVGKL